LDTYKQLLSCCPEEPYKKEVLKRPCDFRQYLNINGTGHVSPKIKKDDDKWNNCANLALEWGFNMVWGMNDPSNTYQVLF
jgi:hypothetical protein